MNEILAWARSVKPDLVRMQAETGIPAWWAAAQFCHESYTPGNPGELSDLARLHFNYAGLKFADWQREFACAPVAMGTWEEINGTIVNLDDAFCSCQHNGGWHTWLKVYASLLTGSYYGSCLADAGDALAFGRCIANKGYATDSRYIQSAAEWLERLRADYADTAHPVTPPAPAPATWPAGLIVEMYRATPDSGLEPLRFAGDWRRSWSQIIPGRFGGNTGTDLLFYDRAGQWETYAVAADGRLSFIQSTAGLPANCSQIVTGHFTGGAHMDVLLYNEGASELQIWSVGADGKLALLNSHPTHETWRRILPIQLSEGGPTSLLFYSQKAGLGRFVKADGDGNFSVIKDHRDWRPSWSTILSGSFGGSDGGDLLFYDGAAGNVEFYKVDANGGIDYLGGQPDWARNISAIVPGRFGGSGPADLLCYDAADGSGHFYAVTEAGQLSLRSSSAGWRSSWKQIVPLAIGGSGLSALLFYDPAGAEGGETP
jgi:hypothetical protein